MKEKTQAQQLAEKLFYKPAYAADKDVDVREKASAFAEGYKKYLDAAKTEREAAAESEKQLLAAGYQLFDPKKTYAAGDKIYFVQDNKAIVAATIGTRSFEDGFRLLIAHTDCPRLDLLPHLSAEQNDRKLPDGIRAEELNLLIGSEAVQDEEVKDAVKLNTMILLNEKYGITEKDFVRAEIEIVPAFKARDIGFDRSMVGGYGHDDRVNAYPALLAEIETKNPAYTTVCVLTDKEEIGSDGITGMNSMYVFHFMQQLCRAVGQDDIIAFHNSVCLSADVTAAYDPSWSSAFEPMNGTYAGRGVGIVKYTGSRGKGAASDASAELVGSITRLLDEHNVAWQLGEMGRLDLGGGGTIAKYVANRGIPVLDIGVPVLSMHSPFEVIHKTDLYMAYRAFVVFNQAQ